MDLFINCINRMYDTINTLKDNIDSFNTINKCKEELNMKDQTFGEKYIELIKGCKEKGVVYTPREISEYIISKCIHTEDIINNPYMKICDPSCGVGNFLIPCYEYLYDIIKNNLETINSKHNIDLKENEISRHIIHNNLYGFDIDELAIKIFTIDIFYKTGEPQNNLICRDFILDECNNTFDIIIGNPPYIGHKTIDRDYSKKLKEKYKDIYKDKGDISYCFFKRAISFLKKEGILGFITSRYFMEAQSGEELRGLLGEQCNIFEIVDFYGIRPFKGTGVDPVIIMLKNKGATKSFIRVIKPVITTKDKTKTSRNSFFFINKEASKEFKVNRSELRRDGWILIDEEEKEIIKQVEKKCNGQLKDICNSYQGIITGCDKAFICSDEVVKEECIESILVKPWIKSSYIHKGKVLRENKYIIYSNLIDKEENYPNAINHISFYKERLENRRECKKGYRKWYELQWGRSTEVFEHKKIIFPYKSKNNRFSIDEGSYFSADVYALKLIDNTYYDYELLELLLNSKLYEFYFKTFAKKLGEDIYEYYPNTLMKLMIPMSISNCIKSEEDIYNYFGLSKRQIEIVGKNL